MSNLLTDCLMLGNTLLFCSEFQITKVSVIYMHVHGKVMKMEDSRSSLLP